MPNFINNDTDGGMQVRVLGELTHLAQHYDPEFTDFTVTRTIDRKGYRDERDYGNTSPYQGIPKTLIRIEIELDDDTTPGVREMVDRVIDAEVEARRAKRQKRLDAARAALEKAQRELSEAEAEVK